MSDAGCARLLAEAREEIGQVKEWLLRPGAETMAACVPALERAAACLREVICGDPIHPDVCAAVEALGAEIRTARALLNGAGSLYFGALRRHLSAPEAGLESPSVPPLSAVG